MIGSINIRVNAAQPNKQLCDLFAFQGSPSSIRVLDVPRSIGDWEITSVKLVVAYPNNNTVERVATRVGNVWVATIEGCAICGKVESGYEILADGIDEQGNPVEGYVLGKGNVFVLENSIDVERLVSKFTVRYLKNLPDIPSVGDLVDFNGTMKLFDGHDWISMGGDVNDTTITIEKNGVEVGSFTTNASEATTIDIPVPSTTSELVNDSGFITSSDIPTIPSQTSDLVNDSGFITASAIPSTVSSFENDVGYITASDIPPIPSKTSELDNDSGFITSSDIPAIPSQTSDLLNDSGFITSSAIPSNVGAFTNDVGYLTASTMPPIPSQTSDLENDSGFITLSAIPAIPSNTSDLVNNSGFITASAIPSNVGAFTNDVGYVTSSEVEPASQNIWGGFAEQAYYAARLWMYTDQLARGVPNTANYLIYQGNGVKTRKISQYPWTLTKYYTTTFDPGV